MTVNETPAGDAEVVDSPAQATAPFPWQGSRGGSDEEVSSSLRAGDRFVKLTGQLWAER